MPKVEISVDVLVDLSSHVYRGNIRNLHIRRYKTGENAGKIFAEYSLRTEPKRTQEGVSQRTIVSELLKKAAMALSEGAEIDLYVKKTSTIKDHYTHYLVVKDI